MMNDLFETSEELLVPTLYAPGGPGQFASKPENDMDSTSFYWDKCREQFAKKFQITTAGFFYSLDYGKITNGCLFIRHVEKFLEIESHSKFFKTNRENVVYIHVSNFWKSCYIRRSLFTLVCRLGLEYDGKSWEKYLFGDVMPTGRAEIDANYEMAQKTKNALLRFFLGFRWYVGDLTHIQKEYFPEKHGWVIEFAGKSNEYIKNVLVLENKSKCPMSGKYIFGRELLLY